LNFRVELLEVKRTLIYDFGKVNLEISKYFSVDVCDSKEIGRNQKVETVIYRYVIFLLHYNLFLRLLIV
jgi:hypothetical protein